MGRVSLSSTGFYKTPKIHWDRASGTGRPFYYFAYGAACSEVTIDTLTGEYRVERVDILHDCGKSLNPALDIGQIEGGFVQGMGWLTTEELWWDGQGRLRTHAPSTYKIPACGDRPRIFNVHLFENENREDAIFRSKAVGEPPLMLGISVLHAHLGRRRQRRRPPRLPAARFAGHARARAGCRRAPAPRERPGGACRVIERLAHHLGELIAAGVPVVLVTVAEAKGSTPREAGAAMLVTAERSFGTIGGGRLEWEGIAHARSLLASGGRESRVELPLGPAVGQCCGGHVRLHLRRAGRAEQIELAAAEAAAEAALPLVLLFGAGHVGRALAAALAPLPLRLRWIDGRADEFPADCPNGRRGCGHRPAAGRDRELHLPAPPPSSSPTATASTSPCAAPCSSAATSPISA